MTETGDRAREVLLGTVSGAFGLKGEVRIKSYADPPENIAAYGALIARPGGAELTIRSLRPIKNGLAARVDGIGDRDAAEALRGLELYVPRDRLPEPDADEDEYYLVDLIGLAVVDADGRALGTVRAVEDFGAGPLMEVVPLGRKRTGILVPFTREAVPSVDLKGGRVICDWPGLREAETETE